MNKLEYLIFITVLALIGLVIFTLIVNFDFAWRIALLAWLSALPGIDFEADDNNENQQHLD